MLIAGKEKIRGSGTTRRNALSGIVHYRNAPFTAYVEGYDQPVECTPVVYDDFANCGVGVFYPDGSGQVWGMLSPRNLIAAWRGTEILRHLDRIEHGTLHDAYTAGLRNPHSTDQETIDKIITKIGWGTYDRIMSAPVPNEIVQAIIDGQQIEGENVLAPSTWPITDEVRAGTVRWRSEFTELGIKHPDEVDAEERRQNEIIARFEKLLSSYASYRGLPRHCLGMNHVEGALLTIVDKQISQPDEVLVALAGLLGNLGTAEFTMMMMPFGGLGSKEEAERIVSREKREAAETSAKWLTEVTPGGGFFRRRHAANSERVGLLLIGLLEEHFPAKGDED
jgi:hypothetical protein